MPTFHVNPEQAGPRLDQFLREQMLECSRAFLQKLIEEEQVKVNGRGVKPSYKVRGGDQIEVEIPPPRPLEAQAEELPLTILFEDDDLIVLNKAPGMVVHPAAGNQEHTLVNALLHHCRGSLAGIGGVSRPGIVHRLDKGTSGCLAVAKSDLAHQNLVAQFKIRQVTKIYRAVCSGKFARLSGRVETIIGRSGRDRKKMAVLSAGTARGKNSVTDYRILKQSGDGMWAMVELTLHTGRTHQIRVHMSHLGHPLLGDVLYGYAPGRNATISIERPLLHAYKLGFTHPRTGKALEFCAPIPDDMKLYE